MWSALFFFFFFLFFFYLLKIQLSSCMLDKYISFSVVPKHQLKNYSLNEPDNVDGSPVVNTHHQNWFEIFAGIFSY